MGPPGRSSSSPVVGPPDVMPTDNTTLDIKDSGEPNREQRD